MARLLIHVGRVTAPLSLTLEGHAFLPSATDVQHVRVSAMGAPLAEWTFDGNAAFGSRQVVVPSNLIVNGDLTLDLAFPDALRPSATTGSGDSRQLGLFVTDLSVDRVRGLRPGDRVVLGKMITPPSFLKDGWSEKERTGVWSSGHQSSIVLPVADADTDPVLVLEGYGFFPTADYKQRVEVRTGPATVAEWTMDSKTPAQPHAMVIPRRLISGGQLTLDFDFPDATSPAAHNLSADSRQRAFFLTAVGLQASTKKP
jgi:hypothetical protein